MNHLKIINWKGCQSNSKKYLLNENTCLCKAQKDSATGNGSHEVDR